VTFSIHSAVLPEVLPRTTYGKHGSTSGSSLRNRFREALPKVGSTGSTHLDEQRSARLTITARPWGAS
jgi:hypothetical protein